MTASVTRALGVLIGALLLLAACGGDDGDPDAAGDTSSVSTPDSPLFPDDFKVVCSGATESRAADYATSQAHKAVYFETYKDDLLDQSSRLPGDWTVQFDPNGDVLTTVDVVACAIRSEEKLAQKCEGYEDEESGTVGSVNWYTGTYELTAYEARSGTPLGSATIEADDPECPLFASFDDGEDEVDLYDAPSDEEIAKFLKAFVQP